MKNTSEVLGNSSELFGSSSQAFRNTSGDFMDRSGILTETSNKEAEATPNTNVLKWFLFAIAGTSHVWPSRKPFQNP